MVPAQGDSLELRCKNNAELREFLVYNWFIPGAEYPSYPGPANSENIDEWLPPSRDFLDQYGICFRRPVHQPVYWINSKRQPGCSWLPFYVQAKDEMGFQCLPNA